MWHELDLWLFTCLTPGNDVTHMTPVATWLAEWCSVWLLCVTVVALVQSPERWSRLVLCLFGALVAQVLAHTLAQDLNTPRPFMLGLSANHLDHGMRGGLPSAHASVMFALGSTLWLTGTRGFLAVMAALPILLTAWARVYAGAHFPLDVVAGAALGMCVAWICTRYSWLRHRFAIAASRGVNTMVLTATGDRT